jgi:PKD repeat protein
MNAPPAPFSRLARALATLLLGSLLLTGIARAQVPGELLRAVRIPGSGPGGPQLQPGDSFGRSLVTPGDIDGDGIPDLLVGASNCDDGATPGEVVTSAGSAWLVFLNSDGTARESVKYSSLTDGLPVFDERDFFGKGVGVIGDFDGNGVIDIVVGAPGDDDGEIDHGAIYILLLDSDGSVLNHHKISGTEGGLTTLDTLSEFGRGIAPLGDLDGDGVLDLAVSRMPNQVITPFPGGVYILFMNADGTVREQRLITLATVGLDYCPYNLFGFCLTSQDLDGDGVLDLVSGDISWDGHPDLGAEQGQAGAVYFITLNPSGTPKSAWFITEGERGFTEDLDPGDHFGSSVDIPLIDFDGDGVNDILVGRKRDDDNIAGSCWGPGYCDTWFTCCADNGAFYVLFMNEDWTVKGHQKISNLQGNFPWTLDVDDRLGQSLDALGDLNGDGFPEVAVSARWDDGVATNAGVVYICTISDGSITPTSGSITADVTLGTAPLTVSFTDTSVGTDLDSWDWRFEGGGSSSEQHPTHVFTVPGTYSVRLDVDGLSGWDRVLHEAWIEVMPAGFGVDFDAAPLAGPAPLEVQFTDRSFGDLLDWSWDFGDGGTSSERDPLHVYVDEGLFSVTLTVTDAVEGEGVLIRDDLIEVGSDFIRIGCDPAVENTLSVESGVPEIGTTMVFGVDNPFGTQAAGSAVWLRAAFAPAAEYPCGIWKPNFGMAHAGAPGEILLSTVPTPFTFSGTAFGGAGNPGLVTIPIPNNIGLIGTTLYCQGVILDLIGASGVNYGVTDGVEFVLR